MQYALKMTHKKYEGTLYSKKFKFKTRNKYTLNKKDDKPHEAYSKGLSTYSDFGLFFLAYSEGSILNSALK